MSVGKKFLIPNYESISITQRIYHIAIRSMSQKILQAKVRLERQNMTELENLYLLPNNNAL